MDEKHKRILRTKAKFLSDNLFVDDDFVAVFIAHELFSEDNREHLLRDGRTRTQRASDFRALIIKRGPKAFEILIDALVQTNQVFIAEALDSSLTAKYTEQSSSQPCQNPVGHATRVPDLGQVKITESAPIMTVNIQSTPATLITDLRQRAKKEHVYNIKHQPRGNFVIINNEKFLSTSNKKERYGSDKDLYNLGKLAEALEFQEIKKNTKSGAPYLNLTAEEIKTEIHHLSKQDYTNHDAFIMAIMSHGAKGVIYGTDGEKISIENDVLAPFDGKNCPTLSGKPKIFIIQACQGKEWVKGVPQADGDSFSDYGKEVSKALENLSSGDDNTDAVPVNMHHDIPHKADMLIAYSTVNDYVSIRRCDTGSWFIRAIIAVFNEHAHEEDLLSMFTMVKKEVSAFKTQNDSVQMPRVEETFRKKFYFVPGFKGNLQQT